MVLNVISTDRALSERASLPCKHFGWTGRSDSVVQQQLQRWFARKSSLAWLEDFAPLQVAYSAAALLQAVYLAM
jgi:hypothetical protein